jgi:hypothetical protein
MDFDDKWNQRIAFQCSCCFTNYTMNEFYSLHSVWIDGDKKYGKTTACGKCGKLFHNGKWQLKSFKDIFVIYTTHLEMPQCSPNFSEDIMDSKYFWETMIQNTQNGDWLGFQARYNNQKDAQDGHWLAYDNLENMLLYPEKYPMGIIEMFSNAMGAVSSQKNLYSQDTKQRST